MLPEKVRAETVDPGIDQRNRELLGRGRLLFDDGQDLAILAQDDASIAGGIIETRGNQGRGSIACRLAIHQFLQRRARKQRAVAIRDHHQSALRTQSFAAHHERVAGALLFFLLDEPDSGMGQRGLHLFGLTSHHYRDLLGRRDASGCIHDMLDEREPSRAMQHFGTFGFHARAQAGGQDHDIDR